MSIFRSTFNKSVSDQLGIREESIQSRSVRDIQFLNASNAWIRMSSSVDVAGDSSLSKQYILLGGTLRPNGKLRAGIGSTGNEAYSTKTPSGKANLLGIRPMPGINSIEVKSKTAYGSLREVIVHFQCWDIRQLEDLELLYMRPGYTALVEWGWVPYINNKGIYQSNFTDFYDIINKPPTDRTTIFKDLFAKCNQYSGNYDAIYGYIKNYQWTMRPDGGYDCQTTIITTGELIESLKINYLRSDLQTTNKSSLLSSEVLYADKTSIDFGPYYAKNVLAGLCAEIYEYATNPAIKFYSSGALFDNRRVMVINNAPLGVNPQMDKNTLVRGKDQVYVSMGMLFDLFNTYVIIKDEVNNKPLIQLSLDSSEITNDTSEPLLCIAHPLQVSVDPTVCLIKSPVWSDGDVISTTEKVANNVADNSTYADQSYDAKFLTLLNFTRSILESLAHLLPGSRGLEDTGYLNNFKQIIANSDGTLNDTNYKKLIYAFKKYNNSNPGFASTYPNFTTFLNAAGLLQIIKDNEPQLVKGLSQYYNFNNFTATASEIGLESSIFNNQLNNIVQNSNDAIANVRFLKDIPLNYFTDDNKELGIIKNIYINVDYLYKLSLNESLELQDKKEKNEISLYSYLKEIINRIQVAIGNLNNFEIHVDPVDNNIARIIDINYTGPKVPGVNGTYAKLFELQVQNLKSIVRNYNMQSQIFPEQSAIIAIGSQAKGGQLGMQTNTMIDFNKNLIDRITPNKGINDGLHDRPIKNDASVLNNALSYIIQDFATFNKYSTSNDVSTTQSGNTDQLYTNARNALRDIIIYFQSITDSSSKNRNLIPIKFSFEMNGIGGLVIGQMFRLPKFILPSGYRGDGDAGTQLGQAITSISHSISNDWVTKIEALNIVLQDFNDNGIKFEDLDLKKILASAINTSTVSGMTTLLPSAPPPGLDTPNADNLEKELTDNKIATVKSGELKSGGEIEQGIAAITYSVLATIKNKYPDIILKVTAGNDAFHQGKANFSNHKVGKSVDFTIQPNTPENRNKVESVLNEFKQNQPLYKFINEYNNPSLNATGGHFHTSFNVITKGA